MPITPPMRRLRRNAPPGTAADRAPGEVADPATLGTPPDLLEHFWTGVAARIPHGEGCRRAVHGRPALVHPRSGVIFGMAGGSFDILLRLPPAERAAALAAGAERIHHYPAYPEIGIRASSWDLAERGEEWVFCGWLGAEDRWCYAAWRFAGEA